MLNNQMVFDAKWKNTDGFPSFFPAKIHSLRGESAVSCDECPDRLR
jgi:hypothetical protein